MSKVLILVEGQTEQGFIENVLSVHLASFGVFLIPIVIPTKAPRGSDPAIKGGSVTWRKIKKTLLNLLGDSSATLVTTMFDFYTRPDDWPGNDSLPARSCYDHVRHLEAACTQEIAQQRFYPYLSLHEFEALLFTVPETFAASFPELDLLDALSAIKAQFKSPEEINDDPSTAPSKRIMELCPAFRKRSDGPIIAELIGLDAIRAECPHFNEWLTKLESVGQISA
jgi:Domain of unknown function (DUF4276)